MSLSRGKHVAEGSFATRVPHSSRVATMHPRRILIPLPVVYTRLSSASVDSSYSAYPRTHLFMAVPGWQTADLDEEWVESSPSPINHKPLPTDPPAFNPSSINAKRGSLRALGHAARSLPPPRVSSSPTTGSPRIISGHGAGRVLSEKVENGAREDIAYSGQGGLLSPPGSGDEQAGTFLVKDGVDDDRGRFLASKGRDMFGPTALEKMFRPPSPQPPIESPPASTSPTHSPPEQVARVRRASHPYAPANPSRLSKSVTPSTASSSFSATLPHDAGDPANLDPPSSTSPTRPVQDHSSDESHRELRSGEVETDLSPMGSMKDYPFTFTAPRPEHPSHESNHEFNAADTTHSTVHHAPSPQGLRLFRSTYDTYTREHLSALVDSIAVDPNHSSPWSPEKTPSEGAAETSPDSRSSKRMRMSPVSPARRLAGVRDWAQEGKEMMERLREESTTSASRSSPGASDGMNSTTAPLTSRSKYRLCRKIRPNNLSLELPPTLPPRARLGERREGGDGPYEAARGQHDQRESPQYTGWVCQLAAADNEGSPSVDYASGSSQSPIDHPPNRPTHRSYPSTTSSTYLRRAEDLMAQIQARGRSTSTDVQEESKGGTTDGSGSDSRDEPTHPPSRLPVDTKASPRRRRRSSSEMSPHPDARDAVTQANLDTLNRFVSATTAATSTTTSTSFVKHKGGSAPNAIRVIRPDDVAGIVGDRVGKMRYDPALMRWIKDREPLGRVDEVRESRSRSEESDVFAGINSWGRDSRMGEGASLGDEASREEAEDSSEDGVVHLADTTLIIPADTSLTTDSSESEGEPEPIRVHVPRPTPHHANSAPAVMTPTPNPNASLRRPIRSALRNANPGATPGVKKQTQWHESVTPAPDSARRSVSFSDGKKHGKIRELHPDETIETVSEADKGEQGSTRDDEFFRGMTSWMPSARTKRIEGMLGGMEELSKWICDAYGSD